MENPSYLTLTLQHFQCFILVVESQTMVRAAEILNVSQPLLSQKIAQLEKEVGVKLFSRSKGKLLLTDAGTKFLEDAKLFLGQIDQSIRELKENYIEVSEKPIRLGFSDGHEALQIKKTMEMLRMSFPNVRIEVEIDNRLLIKEKLLNGEIDIINIVDTEKFYLNKNINYRKLYYLPLNGLVNKDSPLAGLDTVKWSDLNGLTCYWPESLKKTMLTRDIQKHLRTNGIDLSFQFRKVDYYTLRKYLTMNDSITFTLTGEIDDPALKLIPLGGLSYPFIVAWKKSEAKRLEPYMERLVALLKIMTGGDYGKKASSPVRANKNTNIR